MLGYCTLGTNDLDRARGFYDSLLAEWGATRVMELPRGTVWASSQQGPMLGILTPFNEEPATVGNGTMVALAAASPDMVQKVHAKALSMGAENEGDPGNRGGAFFGGYFRDPDGNKLCVFCMA
jgi:catechol 2,3-dioxygenase-like lactoylglutathione lyase family enzyme